ncbi:kinase-like domain-containing protein [Glomus cerebriforme]|uniref:Kinase-like domain-containing protein n=1 Tax=Glomus cerebriforme TaxID=658196 RepID=A0A397RYJ6_9GLOM|nr:kinase-like domain-containing protein [Glomus cerebriforme]
MSKNNEMRNLENADEGINWIEEAINKKYIKYYEFEHFNDFQEIGSGAYGKVFRASYNKAENYFALKSFFNLNSAAVKGVVREIKLQRDVDFHSNIISFYGITKSGLDNKIDRINYLLVMEFADGGTLRNYLKKNFNRLTWDNKYNLAYQLACAVSCLHDEKIVHRDLHSCNVLVHQDVIKLADFGLSKRIEEASDSKSKLFGMVPYIDPKSLMDSNNSIKLKEKRDVYSIGVLLWEISSGIPPFNGYANDFSLMYKISQGRRETIIPDTPDDYADLYTECWDEYFI